MKRAMNILTGEILECKNHAYFRKMMKIWSHEFNEPRGTWIYRKNWAASKTFQKYWRKAGLV